MDNFFLRIGDHGNILNRIVQRISKNRTDVCHMNKLQQFSVRDAGKCNPGITDQRHLSVQHTVQYLITRLAFRLIGCQLVFHLINPFRPLFRVLFCPQSRNLMF